MDDVIFIHFIFLFIIICCLDIHCTFQTIPLKKESDMVG